MFKENFITIFYFTLFMPEKLIRIKTDISNKRVEIYMYSNMIRKKI